MIRFFTYSQYHNKRPPVGSTKIRVHQLFPYWPEADLYTYGENPDVLIFQKVYVAADYKFPIHFENIKILDICDPDWLEGVAIKEMVDAMDAVTVPTVELAKFIMQLTNKPVIVIPDRFDLAKIPQRRRLHMKKATSVGWFGYSHNAELLRPALLAIKELGLTLTIISNDDPYLHQYPDSVPIEKYKFVKYDEDTIYNELQKVDFVVFPEGGRPRDRYKSNNKTIKAILANLPVAINKEELESFIDPQNRRAYLHERYDTIKEQYDVRKSVEQYKELIKSLKDDR